MHIFGFNTTRLHRAPFLKTEKLVDGISPYIKATVKVYFTTRNETSNAKAGFELCQTQVKQQSKCTLQHVMKQVMQKLGLSCAKLRSSYASLPDGIS
jgi:hypothetical protein